MTITLNEPAMPHLPSEKSVTLGDKGQRIHIHPWLYGVDQRLSNEVYVAIGDLSKEGESKSQDYSTGVFDRADFTEALLAVFPELVRR